MAKGKKFEIRGIDWEGDEHVLRPTSCYGEHTSAKRSPRVPASRSEE
jgi:hypothetical protein